MSNSTMTLTKVWTAFGRASIWQSDDGLWNWRLDEWRHRKKNAFGTGLRSLEEAHASALESCGKITPASHQELKMP